MKLVIVRHLCLLYLLGIVISFCAVSGTENLDSAQIKSAYIYNFIKHVHWPEEAKKSQFTIAVYNDLDFFKTLNNTLDGRLVKNKVIKVISVSNEKQARNVDILYLPAIHNAQLTELAGAIRSSKTLLISDGSKDKNNVMINLLHNKKTSAISFEVNKSNIIYEKLNMSVDLLLFGGTELDVATLYRETEIAMQKIKLRERELNKKLVEQEQQITASANRLTQLNQDLFTRNKALKQQENKFDKLKLDVKAQKITLNEKENKLSLKELELSSILDQLSQAEARFEQQQQAVIDKENKNKTMALLINKNKKILHQQQIRVNEQLSQLDKKDEELVVRNETINEQQTYILITSTLIIIATLVSILVVVLFIKNKKTTTKLGNTLTNLKDTQDQLIQSEKMASLGTLTAGIAHEINTPLGIAVTSTSSAVDSTESIKEKFNQGSLTKSTMKKYFDDIEKSSIMNTKALERVIVLLTNFKQVAADQVVGEPRELDLVEYVEDIMGTLFVELKRNRVNYEYKGIEHLTITTIPGAIAQVLTNFVTNSIRHGFDSSHSGHINIEIEALINGGAKLTYQDDGSGMTNEVLNNIYEPFFTTKRNKGGTGLGMNIVYNIINTNLAGDIVINSEVDKGTTIVLTLPASI